MWKPIGKVEADFETMISKTAWGEWNEGKFWRGKNRQWDKHLKGTIVAEIGDSVNEQISGGAWRWHINCTYRDSITKPHKDFGSPRFRLNTKDILGDNVDGDVKFDSDVAKEAQQKYARFWVPMRDREFGQYFEAEDLGLIHDWKAGDVFSIPVSSFHAGATVSFDSRYTMCLEGEKIKLKEKFLKGLENDPNRISKNISSQ